MIHFTPREKEILKGLSDGLTNEEIRLGMKPNAKTMYSNVGKETFNIHIHNIYKKLRKRGYDFEGKNQFERRQVLLAFAHYYYDVKPKRKTKEPEKKKET